MKRWMMALGSLGIIWWIATNAYGQQAPSTDIASASSRVLVSALKDTHATLVREDVSNWSTVSSTWMNAARLQSLANRLSDSLQVSTPRISVSSTNTEASVSLAGVLPDGQHANIILTSMDMGTHQSLTVLSADLTNLSGRESLASTISRLKRGLVTNHIVPSIRASVQGRIPQQLEGNSADRMIGNVFQHLGIHKVESLVTPLETSVSGYTPELPETISTNRGLIDVQMALHYDALTHATMMTIGTPIITQEY